MHRLAHAPPPPGTGAPGWLTGGIWPGARRRDGSATGHPDASIADRPAGASRTCTASASPPGFLQRPAGIIPTEAIELRPPAPEWRRRRPAGPPPAPRRRRSPGTAASCRHHARTCASAWPATALQIDVSPSTWRTCRRRLTRLQPRLTAPLWLQRRPSGHRPRLPIEPWRAFRAAGAAPARPWPPRPFLTINAQALEPLPGFTAAASRCSCQLAPAPRHEAWPSAIRLALEEHAAELEARRPALAGRAALAGGPGGPGNCGRASRTRPGARASGRSRRRRVYARPAQMLPSTCTRAATSPRAARTYSRNDRGHPSTIAAKLARRSCGERLRPTKHPRPAPRLHSSAPGPPRARCRAARPAGPGPHWRTGVSSASALARAAFSENICQLHVGRAAARDRPGGRTYRARASSGDIALRADRIRRRPWP